jgi:hypothetical protein
MPARFDFVGQRCIRTDIRLSFWLFFVKQVFATTANFTDPKTDPGRFISLSS